MKKTTILAAVTSLLTTSAVISYVGLHPRMAEWPAILRIASFFPVLLLIIPIAEFILLKLLLPKESTLKIALATITMNVVSVLSLFFIEVTLISLEHGMSIKESITTIPSTLAGMLSSKESFWRGFHYLFIFLPNVIMETNPIIFTVVFSAINTCIKLIATLLFFGKTKAKKLLLYIFIINATAIAIESARVTYRHHYLIKTGIRTVGLGQVKK